ANPAAQLVVAYHNDVGLDRTFTDPEWGKTTAHSQVDRGADILFGAGGKTGNGALIGTVERGKWAIGVDADPYYTVPEAPDGLPLQRHDAAAAAHRASRAGGERGLIPARPVHRRCGPRTVPRPRRPGARRREDTPGRRPPRPERRLDQDRRAAGEAAELS